jgi:hypothetical protein
VLARGDQHSLVFNPVVHVVYTLIGPP